MTTQGIESASAAPMSHALLFLLSDAEREQARHIWDLIEQDDGSEGFEALKAASETLRMVILEVAESSRTSPSLEPNPFA